MGIATVAVDGEQFVTPPRSPEYSLLLAEVLDDLGWTELERQAHAVLGAMVTIAEAAGSQRREATISRPKPTSTAPHGGHDCRCRCPSLRDHHQADLERALESDVADGGDPIRFRSALLRAADALRVAVVGNRPIEIDEEEEEDVISPERADLINERYQGIPSLRASFLESNSGRGYVSRAALRRCRSRGGYGLELGWPHPPNDELVEQVRAWHKTYPELSDRQIARDLDVSKSAVSRWLQGHRAFTGSEAA